MTNKENRASKIFFAHIGIIIAVLIWTSTFFVIKDLARDIDPIPQIFYRMAIASLILWVFLYFKNLNPFKNFRIGMLLGILLWFCYIPSTTGIVLTSVTNAAFIGSMAIIFVPLISIIFLKAKLEDKLILSILLTVIGLWILVGNLNNIHIGDILILISAVAGAIHLIVSQKYIRHKHNPYILCFQQFFTLTILSFFTVILTKGTFHFHNFYSVFSLLYLGIFPTFLAMLIQIICEKYINSVNITLIGLLDPVLATIIASQIGYESISSHQVMGGLLIILGVVISEIPKASIRRILSTITSR